MKTLKALVLLALSIAIPLSAISKIPNIVFILADDWGLGIRRQPAMDHCFTQTLGKCLAIVWTSTPFYHLISGAIKNGENI